MTNAQFAGYFKPHVVPPGKEDHPVKWVNWHIAVGFCKLLSAKTGRAFRLPTEAEWEKASKGTDGRIWPWGNQPPTAERYGVGHFTRDTTPVGRYPKGASPYGVLDMAGNVGEWTSSLYRPYPYDPYDGREDLETPGARVVRGGGLNFYSGCVRCASRGRLNPESNQFYNFGFRVVASP